MHKLAGQKTRARLRLGESYPLFSLIKASAELRKDNDGLDQKRKPSRTCNCGCCFEAVSAPKWQLARKLEVCCPEAFSPRPAGLGGGRHGLLSSQFKRDLLALFSGSR